MAKTTGNIMIKPVVLEVLKLEKHKRKPVLEVFSRVEFGGNVMCRLLSIESLCLGFCSGPRAHLVLVINHKNIMDDIVHIDYRDINRGWSHCTLTNKFYTSIDKRLRVLGYSSTTIGLRLLILLLEYSST